MKNTNGFTLIELSIILVIIGFITAGVMISQNLIRTAAVQSVIKDVIKFKTAINAYAIKYDALPGDHSNAQSYFTACVDSGAEVCNGNGNKKIKCGGTLPESPYECYRAWQHLYLSGIINESYDGRSPMEVNRSMPASKLGNKAAYHLAFYDGSEMYGKSGNAIHLAMNANWKGDDGVLNTIEAISIDTKMDDGIADSGNVFTTNSQQSQQGANPLQQTCVTNPSTSASSAYTPLNEIKSCSMHFFFETGS